MSAVDEANRLKATEVYTFTSDQTEYGNARPVEAEFSLGGPMGRVGGFYLTTRYNKARAYMPNEYHLSIRHSLKLTFRPSESGKLTGSLMVDDGGKLGGWTNRDFSPRYIFYLPGYSGNKKLGTMGYLSWTHSLSPRTFYEVKVSQLNRTSEFGYSDDDNDGFVEVGEDGDFIVLTSSAESDKYLGVNGSAVLADGRRSFFSPDPGNEKYFNLTFGNNRFRSGQPGFYYEDLDRNAFQIKGDLTSQVNYHHQVKADILYRYHTVSQFQQRTQVKVIYDNLFPFETTEYTVHPKEYAVYVQDRIEYEGIIINGGVRLDAFDVGVTNFTDFFNPSEETTLANGQKVRQQLRGESVDLKWFFQPRLGISHPITENAAMHYSWGKFYSPPAFSYLYDNFGVFANPSLPFVVDVDAEPVQATAYEMGIQYGFDRNHLIDVTGYYRDIENYGRIGYAINPDQAGNPGFGSYTFQTSFGYADARGVEFALERRAGSPYFSGRVNYAYSYIKAAANAGSTSHVPDKTSYSAVNDTEIPFADRHTFNTYEQNVNGGDNALIGGYDRKHRFGLTLTADFSTLTPSTGDQLSLTGITALNSGFFFRVRETTDDPRDREVDEGPWTFRTDLRLTYGVKLGERRQARAGQYHAPPRQLLRRLYRRAVDRRQAGAIADRQNREQRRAGRQEDDLRQPRRRHGRATRVVHLCEQGIRQQRPRRVDEPHLVHGHLLPRGRQDARQDRVCAVARSQLLRSRSPGYRGGQSALLCRCRAPSRPTRATARRHEVQQHLGAELGAEQPRHRVGWVGHRLDRGLYHRARV